MSNSLLRKWNKRYNTILRWLVDIKFLEEAPYKYCPGQSICKYYKVHMDWTLNATMLNEDLDRESPHELKRTVNESVLAGYSQ